MLSTCYDVVNELVDYCTLFYEPNPNSIHTPTPGGGLLIQIVSGIKRFKRIRDSLTRIETQVKCYTVCVDGACMCRRGLYV